MPPYRSTVPERRSRAALADEGREMVRSFRSAGIRQSVLAPAKLVALRRIDALQTNARAVDFERVAVNDARPADEISLGRRSGHANKTAIPIGHLMPPFRAKAPVSQQLLYTTIKSVGTPKLSR